MSTGRKRCCRCGKLTFKWEKWGGGAANCYDGCYSTTGRDYRTIDGEPGWLPFEGKKAWDKSRLWSEYWKRMDAEAAQRKAAKLTPA